jgi:LCP family protein required for cell wall assembly
MTSTSLFRAAEVTLAPSPTLTGTLAPEPDAGIPDAPLPAFDGPVAASVVQSAPTASSIDVPKVAAPAATPTPKSAFQVNIPNRYLNVVLLGSDKRPSSGAWRTDTMIIASLDVETNVVRLLSIPRDLWVYIPGHGFNRINTAELWGELARKGSGTERVKQTIHHNLGIPIHYYARVDFEGFMEIVDAVGGLDIDVACPLPDIQLKPGLHHMDGKQTLRFARSRKSTSDYDRGRRQRKVLLALWDQALTMDMIPRLPGLWRSMSHAFETDLPFDQVLNLAYVGVQLKPQHILSTAINRQHIKGWRTPGGASVLLPREDRIRTLLENFYAPKDPAELDALDKVSVQVLNGTSRNQAATLAAYALRWEGFNVVETGRADNQDNTYTQIIVRNGDLGAGAEIARQLEVSPAGIQDLTGTESALEPPPVADIQVILGEDYDPCKR